MVSIYCIEDINNLKYIGSTKQKLKYRLNKHKYNKKINHKCSSRNLDLENCRIYQLEECNESNRNEREQYHIDNTDCVNIQNTFFDEKQYRKQYHQKNKQHIKQYIKQYREENKEIIKQYDYCRYHYRNSWGGDKRYHNNLLKIDLSLFD